MKNFMYGILAGMIMFVGYNNKSTIATVGLKVVKGTVHAVSNAFTPPIAQSQEVAEQQVAERKVMKKVSQQVAKVSQQVASKVLPQANAAVLPPQPRPQYIASTNNNYLIPQRNVSPQVSQYKVNKRQNSRTSISLVTE